MTEYAPGTVAVATVRGVPNVRVFRATDHWTSDRPVDQRMTVTNLDDEVTDIRPLLVLDPEQAPLGEIQRLDAKGLRQYADRVERKAAFGAANLIHHIAGQIEAQTKPARIPEPGKWGVVEARTADFDRRRTFFRIHDFVTDGALWENNGYRRSWSDLIDPVVLRPGIHD